MADIQMSADGLAALDALVEEVERTPLPATIGPFNDQATRAVFASGYLYATRQLLALARSNAATPRASA
ncbi:hypothetical protein GCM10009606_36490 [Nocardioides aquiterrae]|uniref:Uncharacterized protein n=1 Tax=Nocardioides aquiterrae TaxID=203799 RepID=A0ABP4F3P3_9ACTN